ncbi:MAG TPA: hypothetical protein VGD78_19355 [Chthoniobacterales bacterium]
MRESISYQAARAGDVIDEGGQLAVILSVEKGPDGIGTIVSLSADGKPRRLEWLPGTTPGALGRVGKRCKPTLEGLRDFIRQQVS